MNIEQLLNYFLIINQNRKWRIIWITNYWKEILTTNRARYDCSGNHIEITPTKTINTNCDGCTDCSNSCSLTIWNLEIGIWYNFYIEVLVIISYYINIENDSKNCIEAIGRYINSISAVLPIGIPLPSAFSQQ